MLSKSELAKLSQVIERKRWEDKRRLWLEGEGFREESPDVWTRVRPDGSTERWVRPKWW